MGKRYLLKHVGNMGDLVFFLPPVLQSLKRRESDCHITLVTAWGFKDKKGRWGKRNMGGFCINLMMTNPHIDELVHWHDTKLSLEGLICREDGQSFPTWNAAYFNEQKESGTYDGVFELDFGIAIDDNPLERLYEAMGLVGETYSDYRLYFTDSDKRVAEVVMADYPRPRIVLLEGLDSPTTRGWDPQKLKALEVAIENRYGVPPFWFGGKFVPEYEGRPMTLRENIATLFLCDVGIGVMSGPLHFAAAVGLPTITLYGDTTLHRTAPGFFLNEYISEPRKWHRTLLAPGTEPYTLLKNDQPSPLLTPAEAVMQHMTNWVQPGRQATKTCLAVLTVDEILTVLQDMLPVPESRR